MDGVNIGMDLWLSYFSFVWQTKLSCARMDFPPESFQWSTYKVAESRQGNHPLLGGCRRGLKRSSLLRRAGQIQRVVGAAQKFHRRLRARLHMKLFIDVFQM